jgi:hypothetical protein
MNRKMQIKTTEQQKITSVGKDVQERDSSYIIGGV